MTYPLAGLIGLAILFAIVGGAAAKIIVLCFT